MPKSKEMVEVDVSEDKVQFIKVKLEPGINIINLQAFEDDRFVGNKSVTITYTPSKSGEPSKSTDLTTNRRVSGDDVKKADDLTRKTSDEPTKKKDATVKVTPKEVRTRYAYYTLTISSENLPEDTEKLEIRRSNAGETELLETYNRKKELFNKDFSYSFRLGKGENTISVKAVKADNSTTAADETVINCDPCISNGNSLNTRAIIGLEQVGASSANSETHPFANIFVNFPISFRKAPNPLFAAWTDFRFTSATVQSFASFANVSNSLLNPLFGGQNKINNVVQSFQLNAGFDFRIIEEGSLQGFFIPGRHSVSVIAGGGVTNPLKTEETAQVFKIPTVGTTTVLDPKFTVLFPNIDFTGKTNIAFVSPERDRFFRRWFLGFRIKTRFFENADQQSILDQSPAMFDITVGQDEAITKKLTGRILTLEGFTPFPIKRFDYIYLFGGVSTRLTRRVNEVIPPFFLEPVTNVSLSNSNTVTVPIDSSSFTRSNRDTFRFGLGVDLIRLLTRSKDNPTN